jgi:FtsZ-binding cell division protein ZapB
LGILQREQDHAVALLFLSPLLSSLFVSYANRAAALESASPIPSPESEEWKALQTAIATLQEEHEKLKSGNREMAEKLETAETSGEAFRYRFMSLREDHEIQQDGFRMLAAQCAEGKDGYERLVAESSAEKAALLAQILDLEVGLEFHLMDESIMLTDTSCG